MKERCRFVAELAGEYCVKELCAAMSVSRSSYYRSGSEDPPKDEETREAVEQVFWEHQRRYGARRIREELREQERRMGRHRIRRLMTELGLVAIQPRSYVPRTTQSRHSLGYVKNLLLDREWPKGPSEILVGDITYLPLVSGKWAYLATWTDLFSRRVVGWAVAGNMGERLVLEAMKKALSHRGLPAGAIIHSDRGGQYAGTRFRQLLAKHKLRQSMSRAGETYDNAFAESFFSRFKAEVLEGGKFADVTDAQLHTFVYIDGYYNRIRRHSSLGYLSPEQYERAFTATVGAAAPTVAVKANRLIIDSNLKERLKTKTHSCLTF